MAEKPLCMYAAGESSVRCFELQNSAGVRYLRVHIGHDAEINIHLHDTQLNDVLGAAEHVTQAICRVLELVHEKGQAAKAREIRDALRVVENG